MMMKFVLSLLVVGLVAGSRCNSQSGGGQSWIEKLKQTPVATMEAGLPQKAFNQWLVELTKSAQPRYEVGDCETGDAAAAGKCITVSADTGPMRRLELMFAVPAETGGKASEQPCTFLRGTIGPSDPRNKQPTRLVRKLSDLAAMLH